MSTAARLDLRLSPEDKALIQRAAQIRGLPLSAFVRNAVMRETEQVMAAELSLTLTAEESRQFLDAINEPFMPNEKLANAIKRAQKL